MAREEIKGAVAATTLSGAINNSVTSLTLADGTGWPTGSPGPFVATIDRGLSTEEKILVTTRSTNTLSSITRGYDGTSAQNHANGAVIEHTISALLLDEANRVVSERQGNIGLASAATLASQSKVTGDSVVRFKRQTDGQMEWGSGSGAADVLLRRLQADVLELQDELRLLRATNVQILSSRVGAESIDRFNVDASGKHQWGSGSGAVDLNLYRTSAAKLKTDHALEVAGAFTALTTGVVTGALTSDNIKRGSGTPEGAVTGVVGDIYQRTNGSSATSLYVKESGSGNTGWIPHGATRMLAHSETQVSQFASTAEFSIVDTTVAAGTLVAGDHLRLVVAGAWLNNSGSTDSARLRFYLGGTLIADTGASISLLSNTAVWFPWRVEINMRLVSLTSTSVSGIAHTTRIAGASEAWGIQSSDLPYTFNLVSALAGANWANAIAVKLTTTTGGTFAGMVGSGWSLERLYA